MEEPDGAHGIESGMDLKIKAISKLQTRRMMVKGGRLRAGRLGRQKKWYNMRRRDDGEDIKRRGRSVRLHTPRGVSVLRYNFYCKAYVQFEFTVAIAFDSVVPLTPNRL